MPQVPLNPHEEALVTAFVAKQRRERYRHLLSHPDRRGKLLDRLNHHDDFLPAFTSSLPAGLHTAPQIADWLQSLGAPDTSYVIADDADLDGKTLSTDRAVDAAWSCSFAVIISCLPGKLALFKPEAPESWLVLRRP
jgi:hypothetical protein